MVKVNLDAGRDADAIAMARDVQKQRPKESMGYMLEGDIHVSKKAWPEAVAAYRNGLKNVGTTDLAIRLDASLRASGNVAEADKVIAGWQREHPKDRDSTRYLAEMALGKKDYRGAVTHYKAMLEIQPDDALALNNLAYVSGQLKDPKAHRIRREGQQARAEQPRDPRHARHAAGRTRATSKRGVEIMQQAVALAPACAGIRLNLARALIKDGQKDGRQEGTGERSRSSATVSPTKPRSAS